MIIITSKRNGFRRGGIAHPKGPVEYPDDRFTAEELEALAAEPMLVVAVQVEEKDPDGKKKPPAKKEAAGAKG